MLKVEMAGICFSMVINKKIHFPLDIF